MAYGKSIELFLVNGTADSLVTAELSNWNGKAIKIPRIEVSSCDRNDIKQAGVYFLFCKEDELFNDCGGGCYAMAFVSKLEYDKRCMIHANK